jgi:hypothetical protein
VNVAATEPSPRLRAIVESALGKPSVGWHRPQTGLSATQRFVVRFADGTGVFIKHALDDETEGWLRAEHRALTSIAGSFLPREIAWVDGTGPPTLIVEDLSAAHWPADHDPVLWKPGQFQQLFATLRVLGATPAPAWLPPARPAITSGWRRIAREPDPFLGLGVCSPAWLREALPGLISAEEGLEWAGSGLVHNDVRSDNLCFLGERLILVDWGSARRGPPDLDLATLACTLPLEGGPDPISLMPDGGGWAAYHAANAGLRAHLDRRAPAWLRVVLLRISVIALDWATGALSLPPRTGPQWTEIR